MALTIIERNVQLDLYDHDLTPSKIKAIALDSNTRYVGAEIHNGGQTYDVGQNTGVTLTIIRPDKTGVQITGSTFQYTVGEGESVYGAYAELTQTALAVSGTLLAQFMLTSGEQILRTEIFTINNGVALDATVSEWAGEYQGYNLDELVQNVNESAAKVDAMEQDVSDLKSGFNDLITGKSVARKIATGDTNGYYRLTDGAIEKKTSATYTCQKVTVESWMSKIAFKILSISGFPGSTSIFCAFSDTNDVYLEKTPIAVGEYDVSIPSNAKYIYLCFYGATYNPDGYTIEASRLINEADLELAKAELNAEIDGVSADVDSLQNMIDGEDRTESTGAESGYYRLNDGVITPVVSYSGFRRTRIEVVDWMASVSYSVNSISGLNINATIFCAFADADETFISRGDVAVGEYDLPIPSNAKYIYLSFYGDTYNSAYTIVAKHFVTQIDLKNRGLDNPFDGLSGVAFGTSLTYRAQTTGGFLQYLPDLSGIEFDNQGVGSSYILGDGGSLDMLAKIKSYASYANKRVCLLEGFVNDWYGNKALGIYTDTAETTVCGCVRSALNYIMSQNANITLFLILDPYGRNYNNVDCSSSAKNGSNLTQYAYYSEIAKVAESLGIPVIKEYSESQMSENTPQYYLDNIHPNALGAKQSANFIWNKIKVRYPNAT